MNGQGLHMYVLVIGYQGVYIAKEIQISSMISETNTSSHQEDKMRNLHLIPQFLYLYNVLEMVLSNHLKVRHICEDQHIDITQASGVKLEAGIGSQVSLSGVRFPNSSSFLIPDALSIQFRTSKTSGLLLHGESHHRKHGLSIYIHEGRLRVRITGKCAWVHIRELNYDPHYFVSDNNFHTVMVIVRQEGITFSVDHRDERGFTFTSNAAFSCWHIQNYYFGAPSPNATLSDNPEFSLNFDGCVRYFTTQGSNGTNPQISTVYRRVSSCEDLS